MTLFSKINDYTFELKEQIFSHKLLSIIVLGLLFYFFPIFISFLFSIFLFFFHFNAILKIFKPPIETHSSNNDYIEFPRITKPYLNEIEYEEQTKYHTAKELKNLMNNPKFIKMKKCKGNIKSNWVWQTEERIKKKNNLRESKISDEELENLSINSYK